MTDHCTADFCLWRMMCLVPVPCISSMCHMYMTDFAYDGPIFLVPLSLSYPCSPVCDITLCFVIAFYSQVWYQLFFDSVIYNVCTNIWSSKYFRYLTESDWQVGETGSLPGFQKCLAKTAVKKFSAHPYPYTQPLQILILNTSISLSYQ